MQLDSVESVESSIGIVLSEAFLALYPQLIKQNELVALQLQILIRVLTISALSYMYIRYDRWKTKSDKEMPRMSYKSGAINTLHIGSSYFAFQHLDSSDALSIFYTYPVWNILFAKLLLGEQIDRKRFSAVITALIGVMCVVQPKFSSMHGPGVAAAFIAALTESIMYVSFHDPKLDTTPSERLFEQYSGTLFFVLLSLIFTKKFFNKSNLNPQMRKQLVGRIIFFNALIGFNSHLGRAWAARHSKPELFSVLSMTGVLFGFLYQTIFERKAPSPLKIFGGLLIITGGALGIYLDKPKEEELPT